MKWFKHYHDIRKTPFVKELMNREGKEGYFHYIALLELLCEKFDGENEEVVVHLDDLLTELCIAQRKKLDKFLVSLNQVSHCVSEKVGKHSIKNSRVSENFYFFDVPILFDLQDKDFKFATKKRRDSDPKNKIKNKDKEEDKEIINTVINTNLIIHETANFNETYEYVRNLFNLEIAGKGNVAKENGFFLSPNLREKFMEIVSIEHFKKKENWKKYFSKISSSDFLIGMGQKKNSFRVSFGWVVDVNNAQKVLSGQYDNSSSKDEIETERIFSEMRKQYGEEK